MTNIVNLILGNADYFILMLFRVGALFISSPIFGRVNIPNLAKVGFTVVMGYLFFVAFPPVAPIEYDSLVGLLLAVMGEVLVGVAMGFVTNVFFSLTFTAGQMIDMQIGFGIVNVYDANSNSQIPMVGNILNIILLLLFFAVDGHHQLIVILRHSVEVLPVGNVALRTEIVYVAVDAFCRAFLLGVMVALPLIASGIVLEFCFGMLMRTVPQMNMFVVGVPMKIVVGFLVLILTLPAFASFSKTIFSDLFEALESMIGMLAGVET